VLIVLAVTLLTAFAARGTGTQKSPASPERKQAVTAQVRDDARLGNAVSVRTLPRHTAGSASWEDL